MMVGQFCLMEMAWRALIPFGGDQNEDAFDS
jgi:hypothetical protein